MNERWELLEGRQRRLRLRGAEEGAQRKEDYLAVKNGVGSKIRAGTCLVLSQGGRWRAWSRRRRGEDGAGGVSGAEARMAWEERRHTVREESMRAFRLRWQSTEIPRDVGELGCLFILLLQFQQMCNQ